MTLTDNALLTIIILLQLWTLPWKGMALWKAAKSGNHKWFIALLVINTIGILEIIYLFFIGPRVKIIINRRHPK